MKIKIKGIELLSLEEYSLNKLHISPLSGEWWLKPPKTDGGDYGIVTTSGVTRKFLRTFESDDVFLIRPIIRLSNPTDFNRGDVFKFNGKSWAVFSDFALCNSSIASCDFTFLRNREKFEGKLSSWLK